VLAGLRRDLDVIVARDPAARGLVDAVVNYPGWHALVAHRAAHVLWQRGHRLTARLVSTAARAVTGVDIHPAARLGDGVWIDHGVGVVIGETAVVGDDVTIYQGVTLGGTTLHKGKRHPTIGDRVVVGAGAKVLGAVHVGADSRVGANAVVVRDVPAGSVVVGVPGQVIASTTGGEVDIQRDSAVDLVGARIDNLADRLAELERRAGRGAIATGPARTADGSWDVDFVI
jgi:serine O-acetyltransferase